MSFTIQYDQNADVLRLRLTEFWTPDAMVAFRRQFCPLVSSLTHSHPSFVILSDCREYPVQSAGIGAAWADLLGPDTSITVPYAVVVGSVLNKLQAERALTAPNVKVFTSMKAASDWLGRS